MRDFHLGYTGVSIGWEWGYAKPSGGGGAIVRDNFIHHIGRWELADMGGVYVLGDNPGTRIERNVIAHVSPYHVYGWGVYLDEGASGVVVEDNLVHHTHGGGLHLHFGHNNSVDRNVFACAGGADGDLAFSIGEPHAQLGFSRNVVLRCEPRAAAAAMTSAAVGADEAATCCRPTRRGWCGGRVRARRRPTSACLKRVLLDAAHEAVELRRRRGCTL